MALLELICGVCAVLMTVFPACAGMIPDSMTEFTLSPGVPRMRGDDPAYHKRASKQYQCSPHARG